MKKLYYFAGLFFCLCNSLYCQDILVFKGTVKCYITNDERSTKGAKNVVVVPGFIPQKSGITGEQGYYEINTGVPIETLEDKYVIVYYISACNQCEKKANIFVSSEQARQAGKPGAKTQSYITIPTIKMNAGCKQTELAPLESDRTLNNFISQPGTDLTKVSPLNVVAAPPGLLNLLTNLAGTSLVGGPVGIVLLADNKSPVIKGNINGYGNFLFASPMNLTANTGFNFSPFRDLSESVFWNASALANRSHSSGINLLTNFKNNLKFSGYTRINDDITMGAGIIYTKQEEFRKTVFIGASDTASHLRTLKEYAAFLSLSYKFNKKLSAGLTVKSTWQNFNLPNKLFIPAPGKNEFTDSMIRKQQFDADISFSYNITPALKAGINIMNIGGTELYADAFATKPNNARFKNLRSFGFGLCYKWKQFNFGTDALLAENKLYDLSIGINYVPFNNALLSAGFAFKQKSFSAGFKWKQFRISYIDDNGLMVNEKRTGKSKLFNGRIYSGFVFNF